MLGMLNDCYSIKVMSMSESAIRNAAQAYADVDMWEFTGKSETEFPFLIWQNESDFTIMYWTRHSGMMPRVDNDSVRNYAFAMWLKDNVHPVFANLAEAMQYALEREWPRD